MRLVWGCLLGAALAATTACVEEVDPSLRAEPAAEGAVEGAPAPEQPAEVAVVVRDCAVQLATVRLPAGVVAFQLRNEGATAQELVLRGADGEWESGPIGPGETALLSVALTRGSYQLGCAGADAPQGAALSVD